VAVVALGSPERLAGEAPFQGGVGDDVGPSAGLEIEMQRVAVVSEPSPSHPQGGVFGAETIVTERGDAPGGAALEGLVEGWTFAVGGGPGQKGAADQQSSADEGGNAVGPAGQRHVAILTAERRVFN